MSYKVRKADLVEDRQLILDFWRANHPRSLEWKFNRIYLQNPDGPARVWLAVHAESGGLSGMTAFFPRIVFIKKVPFKAMVAGDFMVAPQHRNASAAIQLQKAALSELGEAGVDLIYGIPNQKAEIVLKRIGYRKLGAFSTMVKPIEIDRWLSDRGIACIPAWIFAPIFNLVLKSIPLKMWISHGGYPCEKLFCFDSRFNSTLCELSENYDFCGKRTAERLEWKFGRHHKGNPIIFSVFDTGGSTALGYIEAIPYENTLDIADFMIPRDPAAADSLMAFFLRSARRLNASSAEVCFFENDMAKKLFRRWGFFSRHDPPRNVNVCCSDHVWEKLQQGGSESNRLLTKFDEDT